MIGLLRFVLRWALRAVILLVLALAALFVFRDALVREYLRFRLAAVTGLETHLGSAHTEFEGPSLTLRDLEVVNAPEFGGGPLLVLPELHLELDRDALFRRELRFRLARVHLAEFNVVKNPQGQTNVFALLGTVNQNTSAADAAVVSPPGLEFTGVETLMLTVGTLRLADLGQPANTREIRVAWTNEVLHNVRSGADFGPLILRVLVRELSAGLGPKPGGPPPKR